MEFGKAGQHSELDKTLDLKLGPNFDDREGEGQVNTYGFSRLAGKQENERSLDLGELVGHESDGDININ